jgi:dCMP deaminase
MSRDPVTMPLRPSWTDYFMSIAEEVGRRSTCKRARVGAVIVKNNRILVTGYNGSPPGHPHCIDVGCLLEAGRCIRSVHAEQNAIATAARYGVGIENALIYTTTEPCPRCKLLLDSAGVRIGQFRAYYGPPQEITKEVYDEYQRFQLQEEHHDDPVLSGADIHSQV